MSTPPAKRESYPPRTSSLGRIPPPPARSEPLAAHPLLTDTTPRRYVPYTPRQRVGPAAVVASQQGPAKVDLANLRIAAQALGVGQGSTGWAILERLVGLGQGMMGEGEEWTEVWSAVVTGKTTLLLPLDPLTSNTPITPEFIKDHIVLSDSASFSANGGVVMLSGMRGLVYSNGDNDVRIKFRSSINPSSKLFRALLDPSRRTQGLGRLVPLAFDLEEEDAEGEGRYPTYELGNYTNSLPLPIPISLTPNTNTTPANTTNTPILKPPLPPLPPRPGPSPLVYSHTNPNPNTSPDRSAGAGGGGAGTGVGAGASRLTSGFASLFGARSSTPPLVRTPPALPPLPPTATAGATGVTGVDGILDGDVGLRTPASSITPTSISTSTSTSPQTPPSSTTSPFPSPATPPLPPPSTLPPSQTQTQTIEIQAYTIPRSIIRDEVGEKVRLGIEKEVYDALNSFTFTFTFVGGKERGEGWVAESVMEFVKDLMPFVKVESKGTGTGAGTNKSTGMTMGMTLVAGKGATATRRSSERDSIAAGGGGTGTKYVIPAFNERIEDLRERFQAFYERLEGYLYVFFSGGGGDANSSLGLGGDGDGKARNESEEDRERRVKEVMELVEKIICELFYDRLYLQPTSDDATHDEALSSRVAALNMLDLGLEHLDVDVSHVGGEGVDAVVKACGETLTQLDMGNTRCPADKAAIIVAAHKVVVDGLSKLPPVRLKSEATPVNRKTQKPLLTEKDLPLPVTHSPLPSGPIEAVDVPAIASSTTLISTPTSDVPTVLVSDPHVVPVDPHKQPSSTPSSSSIPSQISSPPPPPPISTTSTTAVSGDILLPLIIFSVVKANPPHLVSHLLYTQRFRNQRVGGEESYCMINLMAVAEFLENVDLGALGLGESEKKVISTADLTPIPLVRTPDSPAFPQMPSLRGRVEQQVDAIAGSANKVISGVVDTSFGMLRSFLPLPGNTPSAPADGNTLVEVPSSTPWNAVRPGFGLLRRENGFSIAGLAASLPGSKDRAKSILGDGEEAGQQLVSVNSRPGSVKLGTMNEDEGMSDEDGASGDGTGDGEEEEEDEDEMEAGVGHDTRSIKSFESMMSGSAKERKEAHARKSLSDRLAHMPGLSRVSQSGTHKGSPPAPIRSSSLVPPASTNRFDTPSSSRPQSPVSLRLAPPISRFVECHEDDLKVSEVPELLREYKRLVEGVRAIGGFDE